MSNTTDRAALAADTLEGLWNRRDPRVVDERIAPDYIQHNPLIPNGAAPVRDFVESLASVQQPIITVKRAVAQGDLAMVHSHYAWTPTFELDGGRGSAVVDIFRFGPDGRIVEHWDVVRPCRTRLSPATPWSTAPATPTPRRRRSSWRRTRRSWPGGTISSGPATPPPSPTSSPRMSSSTTRGRPTVSRWCRASSVEWDRWS